MVPAKDSMVPTTEPHGSYNRVSWFLQQGHIDPAKYPMVSTTERHGSSKRAMWFLQDISWSCCRDPWFLHRQFQLFLQQSSMVPTTKLHDSFANPVVPASERLGSCYRTPWFLLKTFNYSNRNYGSCKQSPMFSANLPQSPMVPAT